MRVCRVCVCVLYGVEIVLQRAKSAFLTFFFLFLLLWQIWISDARKLWPIFGKNKHETTANKRKKVKVTSTNLDKAMTEHLQTQSFLWIFGDLVTAFYSPINEANSRKIIRQKSFGRRAEHWACTHTEGYSQRHFARNSIAYNRVFSRMRHIYIGLFSEERKHRYRRPEINSNRDKIIHQ